MGRLAGYFVTLTCLLVGLSGAQTSSLSGRRPARPQPRHATWYVDALAAPGGNGSDASPFNRIQSAIGHRRVRSGDTILVAPGTYIERLDFLGKALSVVGVAGPDLTIVDAFISGSAITLSNGEGPLTRIQGLQLQYGIGTSPLEAGGAVFSEGSSATFVDCIFVDNEVSGDGGAVYASSSDLVFRACEFTRNDALGFGGAIYAEFSTVRLLECSLVGNGSLSDFDNANEAGGAVASLSSDLRIDSSTLIGNMTNYSGAGVLAQGGTVDITDSTINENRSLFGFGGGVALFGAAGTISGTKIRSNWIVESWPGGGLYVNDGQVTVTDSAISGNFAGDGGGAYVHAGTVSFEDCRFIDNTASDQLTCIQQGSGGGVYVTSLGSVTLQGCILAGNQALGSCSGDPGMGRGGGIHGPALVVNCTLVLNLAAGSGAAAFDAVLTNSIAWANAPDALAGPSTASYSDIQGGWPGLGNIDTPPLFWNQLSGDYQLQPGSPCIDAGDPTSPLDEDGSTADMGAYPHDPAYVGLSDVPHPGRRPSQPGGGRVLTLVLPPPGG